VIGDGRNHISVILPRDRDLRNDRRVPGVFLTQLEATND
jgi:hypothetical protein